VVVLVIVVVVVVVLATIFIYRFACRMAEVFYAAIEHCGLKRGVVFIYIYLIKK
jgi:hypothetical protein